MFGLFICHYSWYGQSLGINNQFGAFFGGSTILILVGVALDTLQQMKLLVMRKYDGFSQIR